MYFLIDRTESRSFTPTTPVSAVEALAFVERGQDEHLQIEVVSESGAPVSLEDLRKDAEGCWR